MDKQRYAQEHELFQLMQQLVSSLILHQPSDPIAHLLQTLRSPPPLAKFERKEKKRKEKKERKKKEMK